MLASYLEAYDLSDGSGYCTYASYRLFVSSDKKPGPVMSTGTEGECRSSVGLRRLVKEMPLVLRRLQREFLLQSGHLVAR